ncbi:alanine:cation symporter family protein [Bacillus sp. B-TM1]
MGIGNLAGVALAISMGGPGAVFVDEINCSKIFIQLPPPFLHKTNYI